jgi:PTH1 family peptidyl-tRNA hydrolase
MSKIKLFIGLGNPGQRYENTRHNFGFIVLDEIAASKQLKFEMRGNTISSSFYEGVNSSAWLLKPMTFMNFSGNAVSSFMKYYKIKPEEIFVFYDDFSIPVGEYRIRMSGSSGGHNGVNSIIVQLCSEKFPRMKLGIGPLPLSIQSKDYVLSEFTEEEKKKINSVKETVVSFFDEINASGFDRAVSKTANKK